MVYISSYKELIVWKKAMDLVEEIYQVTSLFPSSELYILVAQMRRAAISIPSNIAEGYGRKSSKEYAQFYSIAYGSALELETQLILSKRLEFCNKSKNLVFAEELLEEVLKMLHSMIYHMKQRQLNA